MGLLNTLFGGVNTKGYYAVADTGNSGFDQQVAMLMSRQDVKNPDAAVTESAAPATGTPAVG